jgi:hypothetical protein
MLVIEFKILPLTSGIKAFGGIDVNFNNLGGVIEQNTTANTSNTTTSDDLANPLFFLLIAQGLFAGLVIGKVTEGTLKAGIKHSFILSIAAFLIATGARVLFAPAAS